MIKQFSNNYSGCVGEINELPSLTIPDQSLTIRKLLDNHSRGIQSNVGFREPVYTDMEIPIINDLTEILDKRRELEEQISSVEEQMEAELLAKKTERETKQKQAEKPPKKEAPPEEEK